MSENICEHGYSKIGSLTRCPACYEEIHEDDLEKALRERDEVLVLLAEGLALWNSEPRPSLRSSWYDFWQKIGKETS